MSIVMLILEETLLYLKRGFDELKLCINCNEISCGGQGSDNISMSFGDSSKDNYTYVLRCSDGTYYTGWTNDIIKRLHTHNAGKGAKYTRSRLPVVLVYAESYESKSEAMRREYQIKKLSRSEKELLIKGNLPSTTNYNNVMEKVTP